MTVGQGSIAKRAFDIGRAQFDKALNVGLREARLQEHFPGMLSDPRRAPRHRHRRLRQPGLRRLNLLTRRRTQGLGEPVEENLGFVADIGRAGERMAFPQ